MPAAVSSQALKDERNLQRLILKCKARLSQDNVDTWSGSDRSKFVQYVKYAKTMSELIEKRQGRYVSGWFTTSTVGCVI
ncbi:hypothetical protein BC943DRAFT_111410 [Umbelopsis sp. AD052]|nr:hypothetical protein BC943DRAFT_111410 [Umbelopsis sp. AD052]